MEGPLEPQQKKSRHNGPVFAVAVGREPGIYETWKECEAQVKGFKGGVFKKFPTEDDAKEWLEHCGVVVSQHSLDTLVVYIDGSCVGVGGSHPKAGLGVFYGDFDPRNLSERVTGEQTNQRAELSALLRALQSAPKDENVFLELRSDSQFCVSGLMYRKAADIAGDGSEGRAHDDLWVEVERLWKEREGRVKMVYVKAHVGEHGNEAADQLAKRGALLETTHHDDGCG